MASTNYIRPGLLRTHAQHGPGFVVAYLQAVGCDEQLHSGRRRDRCEVCDGDGQSCLQILANYTKDHRAFGTLPFIMCFHINH